MSKRVSTEDGVAGLVVIATLLVLAFGFVLTLKRGAEGIDKARQEYFSPSAKRARFVEDCLLAGMAHERCVENGFRQYPDGGVE